MLRKILFFYLVYCSFIFSGIQAIAAEPFYKAEENESISTSISEKSPPSLLVIIVTIGRGTLIRMLNSLKPQLEPQDFLTVVFDGRDDASVYRLAEDCLKEFKCQCSIWMEPVNTGYWGHVLHNKYNVLSGDFILHADDDDIYTGDAMNAIRFYCKDSETLYIFKMQYNNGRTLWHRHVIASSEIGKPMGVIPSKYNFQASWGYHQLGDFSFYNSLQQIVPKIEFVDHIIYKIRPLG